jgi:hypothetical protein
MKRKSMWLCVRRRVQRECVCVCVRARERERECVVKHDDAHGIILD